MGAKFGDIRRWNRFVTVAIEAMDENKSYFFADFSSGFSLFGKQFNSSSVSAQTIGDDAAAWDQCAFFAEQIGLVERRYINDASMHHSATARTVMSPSAIFDENVERESIILGISAKELRGYETRTRTFCRRTRWKKDALPGVRDREKKESEKNGAEKNEESGTKTRIDQSRVG